MIVKFNNGNGAFLCSGCRRILYTYSNLPEDLELTVDQALKTGMPLCDLPDLYCNECKNGRE